MEVQTFPDSQRVLIDRVERLIRQRTSGLIRGLRVEVCPGEVILSGRAATYYAKQLATHAALDACENFTLTNDIEVF
jgi:hypothetical protein